MRLRNPATFPLLALLLVVPAFSASPLHPAAAPPQSSPAPPTWGPWVEPDFPFFSSVLDARQTDQPHLAKNLTPRGIVLPLAHGMWVAFDVDLLRVAAIWQGDGVEPIALAPLSYHNPNRKTPGGQFPAPRPLGRLWVSNGIYPGWQAAKFSPEDPREPAPSPEEVGRGPLPEKIGRFEAVRLTDSGVVLEYNAAGAAVRECFSVSGSPGAPILERTLEVGSSSEPLVLAIGLKTAGEISINVAKSRDDAELVEDNGMWMVRLAPRAGSRRFSVKFSAGLASLAPAREIPTGTPAKRWPQEVVTGVTLSRAPDAYVVDDFELPDQNPWRRGVRVSDIQFLPDGTGVTVTLDGDVWLIRGLHDPAGRVRWTRFASGLHEPMTVAIRDGQIYAFDRNGIWRLRDTDGNGEADVHELFSNAFAQTADMREYPAAIKPAPGGEFVIAKGGQQSATLGKHNGSVLRISADGRRAEVLGYGFRQPNIGVNLRTGLVIASDQQGQYVPTTPLHVVRDRQFYGFISLNLPRESYPAPIAEPLTWIPHEVDGSGISLAWLFDARMGPLNDSLIHIGFRRPELFRVLLNHRTPRLQAAVVSVTRAIEIPPLSGSVNPADGQYYVAGFQIFLFGCDSNRLAGLSRVRYTGAPSLIPNAVVPMDRGILLRFDVELDRAKAEDPDSYSIATWKYVRSQKYGSPQLKEDGSPGVDWHVASSAYISRDGRSVFVAIPGMKPVMQMRVGWSLTTRDRRPFEENAHLTSYELVRFDPVAEGFGEINVDLTPRVARAKPAETAVSAEEGRRLHQLFGCMACHTSDLSSPTSIGPTWRGLYGSRRDFGGAAGEVVANEAYLRESILDPTARVVPGFTRVDSGMPSYAGVLDNSQIESILLYIKSLR